jgi:hypothetical protein|tara:strand:- start:693 stop:920 length:228 start_codon:yes stop_codon:yes gene_type:complete
MQLIRKQQERLLTMTTGNIDLDNAMSILRIAEANRENSTVENIDVTNDDLEFAREKVIKQLISDGRPEVRRIRWT